MADSIKRYLSELNVEYISLVDAGANKKTLIYKNVNRESSNVNRVQPTLKIRKTDEDKHLVYCIVYAPEQVDAHGDGMKAEEIEKAAHAFMKAARTDQVDKQHNEQADQGHVVESWIARKNDELFPDEEGAWAVAIKVADEDTWQAVKAGAITGVSMQGWCKAVPYAEASEVEAKAEVTVEPMGDPEDEGLFKRFIKAFMSREDAEAQSERTAKDFNEKMLARKYREAVWALQDSVNEVLDDEEYETMSARKGQVLKLISQFETYVKQLKKETKSFNPTIMSEKSEKSEAGSQKSEKAKKQEEQHEDFTKVLKSALDEAFEPVTQKLEKLEERLESLEKSAPGQAGEQGRDEQGTKKKRSKGLKII